MSKNRPQQRDSQRKTHWGRLGLRCLALGSGLLAWGYVQPALASTNERIWTGTASGIAIGGYDPMTYFVDGLARQGSSSFEWTWQGVTWRFRNEGNLSAFKRHPVVYAPQLGGYGVMAAAEGLSARGHPHVWSIHKGKLYLFYSTEARSEWRKDPDKWTGAATAKWPAIERTLSR